MKISFQVVDNKEYYQLKLLCLNDEIVIANLFESNNESYWISQEDLLFIYIDWHNEQYKVTKSIRDIKREFLIEHMFSSGCGFSGEPTKYWIMMEEYVREEKFQNLWSLICNTNLEIQAYGVIGIKKMIQAGYDLSIEQEQILSYVLERNAEIVTCMGCIPGELHKLTDLISWYVK